MSRSTKKVQLGLVDLPSDVLTNIFRQVLPAYTTPELPQVGGKISFFSWFDDGQDYSYGQAYLAPLMRVCKTINKVVGPILYNRILTYDLLHTVGGIDKPGVKGCLSKRQLCALTRFLHLAYSDIDYEYSYGYHKARLEKLYVRTLAPSKLKALSEARVYFNERLASYDQAAKKEQAKLIGRRTHAELFPALEWLTYAPFDNPGQAKTAGSPDRLNSFAPKHVCIRSSPYNGTEIGRRMERMWPQNLPMYYHGGSKEYKTAFEGAPSTTETLTVHLDPRMGYKGALPLSLPHGITRYFLPLPNESLDLIATERANQLGKWISDLVRPKVFPGDQYSFEFYVQCPPAQTSFGQRYRNRMEEVLQEWIEKAEDRELAWFKRAKVPDGEWTPLIVTYELVDKLPWCEGCCR